MLYIRRQGKPKNITKCKCDITFKTTAHLCVQNYLYNIYKKAKRNNAYGLDIYTYRYIILLLDNHKLMHYNADIKYINILMECASKRGNISLPNNFFR